ncbi:hypothetical protein CFP56_015952 [Quercus suber]|uniref:Zinc knuckle CX2CX4HX4C domain-containing protein n=1 Tax=Quercus suber TaxID=58331 RepID=A0AAW0KQZ0_QUESU
MEVDVPESGVLWGKCLRARVCIDVSKRLVRGKKVIIEGGESQWVHFRYERLLNFCYECGMLNHAMKEFPEKSMENNQLTKECKQYEAWLKGESLSWPEERQGGAVGHVCTPSNTEPSDQTKESLRLDKSRKAGAILHEIGKVKGLVENFQSKETHLDERAWVLSDLQADKSTKMQCEKDIVQKNEPVFDFKLAPKNLTEGREESPKIELGPVAMSYDPKEGWISKKLSLNSKHWKQLAKEAKANGASMIGSPCSQKREGPTLLQDLDPNTLS